MAKITINVTAKQSAYYDLGDEETVTQYVQRKMDSHANILSNKERESAFYALTDEQKDTAITAGKGV